MSLWKIAWRSIQQRGLASALTIFSMALGVMLVVAVLSIMGVVSESFSSNASMGYNIIVGAKGGKLQLTLNTVYYLSEPIENIPYDYYLEFLSPEQREVQWEHSLAQHEHDAQWQSAEAQSLITSACGMPGMQMFGAMATLEALGNAAAKRKIIGRRGKFGQFTDLAVPVCLGDYFGRFRVIGTTPDIFEKLKHGPEANIDYKFSAGRNFKEHSEEHSYFEAVVGANVAREKNVKLHDEISPAHGDPEGEGHDQKFTVVGILAPTGTPNDRAVFINMEGFFLMEDHAKPIEKDETEEDETEAADTESVDDSVQADPHDHASGEHREPLPIEQREVTAVLVRTSDPLFALGMPNTINEGDTAQAVLPVQEIYSLLDIFVRPIQLILLVLTAMVCIVSGVGIVVSIYNSMSDRRREIAVMRALGARRRTVMSIILLESIFLSLGGGVCGWGVGHGLNLLASPWIEAKTGVTVSFWQLAPAIDIVPVLALLLFFSGLGTAMIGLLTVTLEAFKSHVNRGLACLVSPIFALICAIASVQTKQYQLIALIGIIPCLLSPIYMAWFTISNWKTAKYGFWFFAVGFSVIGFFAAGYGLHVLLDRPLIIGEVQVEISPEIVLIPGLILLAILVGFLPATAAYRTDVAKSLGS